MGCGPKATNRQNKHLDRIERFDASASTCRFTEVGLVYRSSCSAIDVELTINVDDPVMPGALLNSESSLFL
jgi:hypothetical protein